MSHHHGIADCARVKGHLFTQGSVWSFIIFPIHSVFTQFIHWYIYSISFLIDLLCMWEYKWNISACLTSENWRKLSTWKGGKEMKNIRKFFLFLFLILMLLVLCSVHVNCFKKHKQAQSFITPGVLKTYNTISSNKIDPAFFVARAKQLLRSGAFLRIQRWHSNESRSFDTMVVFFHKRNW